MTTPPCELRAATDEYLSNAADIRLGGGERGIARQHRHGRLTARERIEHLIDPGGHNFECGLFAAWGMYEQYGGAPGAGVVTTIAPVGGRLCMIVANDATVKAGAFFPMTCKKIIRAQMIALRGHLPLIYLVDSAGVFLPLQEDVFPDTDDFGRVFRNNAVISAAGVPQIAAIMGNCVAGGGYLPVLSDVILMTEGSGLYLAGPALVKAAIGQDVDNEELGGAEMHAAISGTVDYREPDDESCLKRLRDLMLADMKTPPMQDAPIEAAPPAAEPDAVYDVFSADPRQQYDVVELLQSIVDEHSWNEYRAEFGASIVCGYARVNGWPCGIVANQRKLTDRVMPGGKDGPARAMNMPAVVYVESADKAARFIMDCNQKHIPIIFMHDTTGFMVGRDSEQAGIIRSGAKMVNAMSNSIVPKISLITGGSYGAGNYAMCGRAFDPFLTLAWPSSRCAVMSAKSAAGTLLQIDLAARKRAGEEVDEEERKQLLEAITASYNEQQDIRYGAAREWVDRIIEPHRTREELAAALQIASTFPIEGEYRTGVLQT
ncbi:MAG: carboxyl transferase domain-containing protein [Phycisphaerales bacterium]|jgi:acetyl-CoA carboxylase carboxyltransferase component|nr:methylcrotonoyl-CoA carboxylase [Planctomycetaceae bacterium]MDP6159031.1 carboxyl transferase domain-containing protein [Phycisphaerales bacterium]MDP6311511.1 carboxyl transferase domain-containing protein [Phycisphaerales bacterium]MDP7087701.1 carboxyl transferase domain-containing protein [Phycisphaerales bacterium]MDP7189826.1 carboxyl transferase domain-containing protein [Phycisphaerales bacterium]|tara:strand:+ start:702 stop:2339 length:1638 start_codon:yes stop_codon:yes gene_type:complete